MKKFFLVDGSSYFYRAFYAIRPLTTAKGLHVNAVYGFATMVLKVLKEHRPDYLSIIFDSKEETFRTKMYPAYKANRAEMPHDLVEQLPYIHAVVDAFRIHSVSVPGYEADDIIGTLCHRNVILRDETTRGEVPKDLEIVIVSSDKDLMQLVSPRVSMLDTMKEKRIGEAEVKEKFGVMPDRVIDVLALAGDASDNIPGVRGIGPKTASLLIQKFGSLEKLLKETEKLTGKTKEAIEMGKDSALLSKQLVTLNCKVPFDFHLKDAAVKSMDEKKVIELFESLEFKRLLEQLGLRSSPGKSKIDRSSYQVILDEEAFEGLLSQLSKASHYAVDLETTSLDTRKAKIVGISFACHPEAGAWYLPLLHKNIKQLDSQEVFKKLKPILESPSSQKWGQNIKYDALILRHHGILLSPISDDSMIASYVLDPAGPHNMDHLSKKYLDHETIRYDDVTKVGKKRIGFEEVPLEVATEYAAEDADVTYRLVETLRKKLEEEKRLSLYEEIEMPLTNVLIQMEFDGIKIDPPFLKKKSKEFGIKMEELERAIHQEAGIEFNIRSTKQLSQILFQKLGLSGKKRTQTGFSTDVEVLEALREDHSLPEKILSYRELAKLKSTYIDALIELADPTTSRVHTSYNQTVAETGRLSSSNPNLQNIPVRTELGQEIRHAFVAEEGHLLLSADYSQVELRILAHLSGDPALTEAFKADHDIHTQTAIEVFGVSEDLVTSEMRRLSKAINFGLIYGLSAFGLSKQLKIPLKKAEEYISRYFSRYPGVRAYIDKTIEVAKERGYVDTILGRRRYLPDLHSANPRLRQMAERMAINSPIQGSAADLIKMAMIRIAGHSHTKMILQVHDELIFEVEEKELTRVQKIVKSEMEGAIQLSVPIKVDLKIGKNWGSMVL